MPQQKRIVLQPSYVKKFSCIGPACMENCCQAGWNITVEKSMYDKYRNYRDKKWREKFAEHIKRDRLNLLPEQYAKIKLTPEGKCPLLDEESLCSVQRNLGEDFLPVVCMSYPRVCNYIDDKLERSLTMSCPEVIKVSLLQQNIMEFDEVEESALSRSHIQGQFKTGQGKPDLCVQQYFWQLRIFIITLLQNREYTLWQRVVILGLFCKKLDEVVSNNKYDQVEPTILLYESMIRNGEMKQGLDEVPAEPIIQMEIIKELADEMIVSGRMNYVVQEHFMRCFIKFLHGIEYYADEGKQDIAQRYQTAYKQYYEPFMAQREYILEHYIVNYIFQNVFPFSGYGTIFENYIMLVIHYAIIKMLLIGTAGFEKEAFNEEHVVHVIQTFSQNIGHSSKFLNHVFQIIKQNKMDNMAYMAILIKN